MKKKAQLAASVRQRLLNLARERGEDFQQLLVSYALERLLYRLAQSRHCDRFILKGALLFRMWFDLAQRPTRDADFLGFGNAEPEEFGVFLNKRRKSPTELVNQPFFFIN
jgi:predicted nucleotidyltransferase component of viral defense system